MSESTSIAWTDHTFNPWWGCTKVSEGCKHCYAEAFSKRQLGHSIWGDVAQRQIATDSYWEKPQAWERKAIKTGVRRLVFCASMADVFEDRGELNRWRARLFGVIDSTPHLVWLLLTKRPENVRNMLPDAWGGKLPDNVWTGATAENRERFVERTTHLVEVEGKHFLSCEPLLEDIGDDVDLTGIDWLIMGGESGKPRRRVEIEWMWRLAYNCAARSVPIFVKQDNGNGPGQQGRIPDDLWAQKWRPTTDEAHRAAIEGPALLPASVTNKRFWIIDELDFKSEGT